MRAKPAKEAQPLRGHALRNHNLRLRSLKRAEGAPPLGQKAVEIRVKDLNITRIQMAKESGCSRGALRDLELGVHTPTRETMERLLVYLTRRKVKPERIEELRSLYCGPCDSLLHLIGRMELKAGSSPQLAKKVGVSFATLWEYRRGNFPVPYNILKKMCKVSGEDLDEAEKLWHEAERQRFSERGFPPSLAEFCILRLRAGHAESKLLKMGLQTSQLKRLSYLELPPWQRVAESAKKLCQSDDELKHLRELWQQDFKQQKEEGLHDFGLMIKKLREKRGISRREVSDLCLVGGKKPARTIKHIEEDGHYSQLAFPAGLVALMTDYDKPVPPKSEDGLKSGETNGFLETEAAKQLRELWEQRRVRFHLRHRPEMLLDLRLAREYYGFDVGQAAKILGYTSLEYQKIERGIESIPDSARKRILEAYERAGHARICEMFQRREDRDIKRVAWQSPTTVSDFLTLLATREGGVVTLARMLTKAKLHGVSTPQLRSYIFGQVTPSWCLLQQIADHCGVKKLQSVHLDWIRRFRVQLAKKFKRKLTIEIKLLIAEVAPNIRQFGQRLSFNCSLVLRDLYRLEDHLPVKWERIERLMRAAGLPPATERWQVIHGLWLREE